MSTWSQFGRHKVLTGILFLVLVMVVTLTTPGILLTDKGGNSPLLKIGNSVLAAPTADVICDGVADNVQFNAMLATLPATGGEIDIVSAGTYTFAATVTRAIPNVTIKGLGPSTVLNFNGVNPLFTAGGNGWQFKDIALDAGGVNMGATTGWSWENVTVGATYYAYRTDDATTASNWAIPTGRGATYTVVSSSAPAGLLAQADYITDGTADEVQINAAITAAAVTGGSVSLIGPSFAAADAVYPLTNVSIYGNGSTITVTTTTVNRAAMRLLNVTNVKVYDLTVIRAGVIAGGGAADALNAVGSTGIFDNCVFQNTATGSDVKGFAATSGTYTFTNVQFYGSNNATGSPNGVDVDEPGPTTVTFNNTYSQGGTSTGNQAPAYEFGGSTIAVLNNVTGLAGSGAGLQGYSDALELDDSSFITVNGGRFYPSDTDTNLTFGVGVYNNNPSIITGAYIGPQKHAGQWDYDDANNGRFRTLTGAAQLVGIDVFVTNAAGAGATLSLGTAAGGSQIVSGIPIDATGHQTVSFTKSNAVKIANAYWYATPSVPIADSDLSITYLEIVNKANTPAVYFGGTNNQVQIKDSTIQSSALSPAVWIPNAGRSIGGVNPWSIHDSLIEAFSTTQDAIHSPAGVFDADLKGNRIIGVVDSNYIKSATTTYVEHFQDVLVDSTATYFVNNEDLSAASPIAATIAAQPPYPIAIQWNMTHANITQYSLAIVGVDNSGDTVTVTKTEANGWTGQILVPFVSLTSITFTRVAGTGVGDVLQVGSRGGRIGLSNPVSKAADVFLVNKNGTNYTATATFAFGPPQYMDMGATNAGDDFTVWYRSPDNMISSSSW